MLTLPQEILARVERIFDYHRRSKYTSDLARASAAHPSNGRPPSPFRMFEGLPKVPLPTGLLDVSIPVLSLQQSGLDALPDSQVSPPQDLKTLATLLHMAAGVLGKIESQGTTYWLRPCPSAAHTSPCEIYVASFAIAGLESGLYHFSAREFALRKLREGPETLQRLKRGRPDLEFLKTVPAALLVSTVFCRACWRYQLRGYRHVIRDAGHVVQNLVTAATGLGLQTITRLTMNDMATRELIGVPAEADFGTAEAVQAMVVWVDRATAPGDRPAAQPGPAVDPPPAPMSAISRTNLTDTIACPMILTTHRDCVAPGVVMREVRPPLTDLSPLPPEVPVFDPPAVEEPVAGMPLRQVLLNWKREQTFARRAIPRDQFITINRLAMRGGTFYPLHPDGPHVALIRPFWILHAITGMQNGIWYYHPPTDAWSQLNHGTYRLEAAYICGEQPACSDASAVCFMIVNLHPLLTQGGPDLYRLAHIEAGLVAQRLALSSAALQLASVQVHDFYDDEARRFLGLEKSGWEIMYVQAIGHPFTEGSAVAEEPADLAWRD